MSLDKMKTDLIFSVIFVKSWVDSEDPCFDCYQEDC
jgi:hypothetical protein